MMTEQAHMSDLAIPPGEYLEEVLEEVGISQAELARRMGRPPQAINEILKGDKAITPETALQLEQVVGVPAYFWSNLEASYRLAIAKEVDEKKAQVEVEVVSSYPYLELSKLGLVEKTRNKISKVKELRKLFGVSSLFNIGEVKEYSPAFRQVEKDSTSSEALAAWLRAGHIIASGKKTQDFDAERLKECLFDIKGLTFETDPNVLIDNLGNVLSDCGIALVLIPHFPKTYTTGATFWVEKKKAVIMMSLRGSWSDIFWFSLMHEIAHILLHDKRATFLENGKGDHQYRKQEEEADFFAQKTLIPSKDYKGFVAVGDFTANSIEKFANNIGIFPGVVTGRLQFDSLLPHTVHHHRIRFKWKKA
ncbi:HigA family addiction module antitoxin [Marinobacter sp. M3C]|jgi:HTH-type transcriptional regulator/antitoxin HigA|uniref:HigA family addiction module antitoxin n=1 Tax=unclassified Marinobacter TaxID=83889 RepID=UPI00200FBBEE|nr:MULTISPECIES: HigA family addiction module antitoxin [unclassified Marinobacter]MCL1480501.1 HigA family addiction module antitoxin [Marinobacter sp.]MCL1487818.1 HigA family addiction module antitoxin [Marinobacter sp.]UQG56293.1 HigA family addiction module antitoxin [Marinobacter sp. M4C]UQG58436.1 HigA family addiction module antitoxin [Marinobacter sp. M3C]UQG65097.1 HigA family addiction module antitoxin [Marinobacter sp. M2C]